MNNFFSINKIEFLLTLALAYVPNKILVEVIFRDDLLLLGMNPKYLSFFSGLFFLLTVLSFLLYFFCIYLINNSIRSGTIDFWKFTRISFNTVNIFSLFFLMNHFLELKMLETSSIFMYIPSVLFYLSLIFILNKIFNSTWIKSVISVLSPVVIIYLTKLIMYYV